MPAPRPSMAEFDSKICVVTGGHRGIGRAILDMFRRHGATAYSLDVEPGDSPQQQHCDISDLAAVEQAFDLIRRAHGRVDVLVNNAATVTRPVPFSELTPEEWAKAMAVNVTGVFNVTRTALSLMGTGGSIINLASTFAHVGAAQRVAYSTSKGAILAFTRSLALDLAAQGIRVNSVSPGGIATARLVEQFGSEQAAHDALAPLHPIGHLGLPAEVADAVWFLASLKSSFATGSDLRIDGGYTAR